MNELLELVLILMAVAGGAVLLYFLATYMKKSTEEAQPYDARQNVRPNDTNYNINMMGDEKLDDASPTEAREILEKADDSDLSSMSRDDYFKLKRQAKG